jgi:phosphatidylinositol phospholipase C, delta
MSESANLTSRLAGLNPFKKSKARVDDDDKGDFVPSTAVAGGGHGARETEITKHQLRVSHALRSFLASEGIMSEEEAGLDSDQSTSALQDLLKRSHILVPSSVTDRSYPLPEYFISSSHNTYLMAHQLYGTSSTSAYENVLNAGCRCVEIDAWDNDDDMDEPKVTHGYTLVSHIPFRAICETIRDVVDKEATDSVDEQGYRAAPIFLSLENHCDSHGQLRLVQIMKEVWGDRLLSQAVRHQGHREQEGTDDPISLDQLGSKIVVIVEYHIPDEVDDSDDSTSSDDDEEQKEARHAYKEKKSAASKVIIPELADLGVYAQSVKPSDDSWFEGQLNNGPHHHLINVSETGLLSKMPASSNLIARHNSKHLMRVFPKGTRISSQNLQPAPFWGVGAQICALNWQTFGASMQLNEALFSGTDGFVLKPAALRSGNQDGSITAPVGDKILRLRIAGASDIPVPEEDRDEADELRPYVTCSLIHPDDVSGDPPKRKTAPYKHHQLGFMHRGENPPVTDPVWNETLEWTYKDNELVFLRILVKSDDSFARNRILAVTTVRLLYVVPGWSFIRLLDLKGRETKCSLLINFEIDDA